MKFENIYVGNFENALRGMRNPLDSWNKSDSYYNDNKEYIIGKNDLELAQRLIKNGGEHRKFMRQIFVSVDITAPLYWWKEADQYKVGTVTNSCSTMHTLTKKPITIDMFERCELLKYSNKTNKIDSLQSEWKTIEAFNNKYKISNLGKVSINYGEQDIILPTHCDLDGDVCVFLSDGKGLYEYKIKNLVAEYFLYNPNKYNQVIHKDKNKKNNNYLNLTFLEKNNELLDDSSNLCYNNSIDLLSNEELDNSDVELTPFDMFNNIVEYCEYLRLKYLKTKDYNTWKALIQILPESFLQKRTITMNYEVIYNMINQRYNHKTGEWKDDFINFCHKLPYSEELLFIR